MSLQVEQTVSSITAAPGDIVTMKARLTNTDTDATEATITATATYTDASGVEHISGAATTIHILRDVTVSKHEITIPALFSPVAGSAKVSGSPVTEEIVGNVVTIPLNRVLVSGEAIGIEFDIQVVA